MQILLTLIPDSPLTLPIGYNYLLQSFIFNEIRKSDTRMAAHLHDEGFRFEERTFKAFVFSQLEGKYRVENKVITFSDEVRLEVRSPSEQFIQRLLLHWTAGHRIELNGQPLTVRSAELHNKCVFGREIKIKAVTPIVTHITHGSRTIYLSPDNGEFCRLVEQNFARKYSAILGRPMVNPLRLDVLSFDPHRDKLVTKYKQTYITGWGGTYRLSGDPGALTLTYNTGLGERNSQGFGMIEIIE